MFTSKIKGVIAVAVVIGLALSGGGVGLRLLGGPAPVAQQPGEGGPGDPRVSSGKKAVAMLAPAPDARKKDLEILQGTWQVVGAEEGGNEIEATLKDTFVIKGGKMTYCRDGEAEVRMTITLMPGKTPKAIDLEFTDDGKEKGLKNHAIYELDGDKLKLRMNDKFGGNSENERPTDFSTDKGKETVLFILKRAPRPADADQAEKVKADAKKDLDKLQGTWQFVGGEEGGNEINEVDLKEAKETFVVKGGKMTYRRDGKVQLTMKITLDTDETPKAMDLEFTDEGKEKGGKNHAIYELDGDKLKLRMNDKFGCNSAGERPTGFSTDKGIMTVLFILKRAEK